MAVCNMSARRNGWRFYRKNEPIILKTPHFQKIQIVTAIPSSEAIPLAMFSGELSFRPHLGHVFAVLETIVPQSGHG